MEMFNDGRDRVNCCVSVMILVLVVTVVSLLSLLLTEPLMAVEGNDGKGIGSDGIDGIGIGIGTMLIFEFVLVL